MHSSRYAQHKLEKKQAAVKGNESHPFRGATAPRAQLYRATQLHDIDTWLREVQHRTFRPNEEQFAVLQGVATRLKQELQQEQSIERNPVGDNDEPMLDLVHGLPGTGKTEVIKWLIELFQVLGWENGVQYICLAVQNVMAANIGGQTIHHWSGIPTMKQEGSAGTKDTATLSIKCQCLRFILLDEISMVSGELLGALEHVIQKVVKSRTLWKKRADDSKRLFGGINVIFFEIGGN